MAEISTAITYTVRLTEKEYKLMAKGLALLAGVDGPKATAEDRAAAIDLNTRLLDQQAADLREKLTVAERKRNVGEVPGDDLGNRGGRPQGAIGGPRPRREPRWEKEPGE